MLVIVSFPVWGASFVAPFLPLSVLERTAFGGSAFVLGEVMFWVGAAILGPSAVARLRRWKWHAGPPR